MIKDDLSANAISGTATPSIRYRGGMSVVLLLLAQTISAAESLDFSVGVNAPEVVSQPVANSPEATVNSALVQLCPSVLLTENATALTLNSVCDFFKGTAPLTQAQVEVLREISPKVNTSPALIVSRSPAIRFSGDIASRLAALRRGARIGTIATRFRASRHNGEFDLPIFRAGSDPEGSLGLFSQRLSGFANGNFASAKQNDTTTEMGFDSRGQGLTVGMDYRFGLRTFMGVSPQFNRVSATLDDTGSELNAQQYAVVIYGSHFLTDLWYVEGTLARGNQALALKRQISLTIDNQTVQVAALGDTHSAQTSVSVGTGTDFSLPKSANLSLMANVVYARSSIDGYTETDAGSLNLTINKQTVSSTTTQLTASLSRAFSLRWGVLIPQLGATWLHELSNGGDRLQAQFAADSQGTQFGFVTQNQDSNYYIVNVDAQLLMPGGRVGFARYSNVRLLRDHTETGVTVGYRMEF